MYGGMPGSCLQRLVELCVQFLICALAIYWAVQLLQAVWLPVLLIIGAGGVLAGIIAWLRRARRGW
jgi:hypothetical protein